MNGKREVANLVADVVLFALVGERKYVLLIRRGKQPFKGRWALPGGHVNRGEETYDAARRELVEETGIYVDILRAVGVYAAPDRDSRGRYVAFAYTATLVGDLLVPVAGDDATAVHWRPLESLSPHELAFDHYQIVCDAARVEASRR